MKIGSTDSLLVCLDSLVNPLCNGVHTPFPNRRDTPKMSFCPEDLRRFPLPPKHYPKQEIGCIGEVVWG